MEDIYLLGSQVKRAYSAGALQTEDHLSALHSLATWSNPYIYHIVGYYPVNNIHRTKE